MAFPTTRWTLVDAARSGDANALTSFVERYRPALLGYLASRGFRSEAEDLAQEVLLRLCNDGVLDRADRDGGRLRSLVLAVARHVVGHHVERRGAKKRGGGAAPVPLDELTVADPRGDDPDETFDREWIAGLVRRALVRLREDHPSYWESLIRVVLNRESYADTAAALRCTDGAIRNYVHRAKRKVIAYLREEVRAYAGPGAGLDTELAYLSRLLDRKPA